jgi:hypothetical protein
VDKFTVQGLKFKGEGAELQIYNLLGRRLLERQIPGGTETVEFDVSHAQSGVYCCRIISDHKSVTRKLIIQK